VYIQIVTRPPDPQLLDFLEAYDQHIADLALALREIILEEVPDASESIYQVYDASHQVREHRGAGAELCSPLYPGVHRAVGCGRAHTRNRQERRQEFGQAPPRIKCTAGDLVTGDLISP
jgi:hypothetical protein